MKLNINQLIDGVCPWDLEVEVDGVTYRTRCPSLGELALLSQGEAASSGLGGLERTISLLEKLIVPPSKMSGVSGGPVRNWDDARVTAVVSAIVSYLGTRVRGNAGAIAARVQAAIASPGSPTSTPNQATPGVGSPR